MVPQTLLSAKRPLGRLERVDLRSVGQGESVHFTPWLAQDENIALLGQAVGMGLAMESKKFHWLNTATELGFDFLGLTRLDASDYAPPVLDGEE